MTASIKIRTNDTQAEGIRNTVVCVLYHGIGLTGLATGGGGREGIGQFDPDGIIGLDEVVIVFAACQDKRQQRQHQQLYMSYFTLHDSL